MMRTEEDIVQTVESYSDMIHRICLCHLNNLPDTEDVFQNVFLKYMESETIFQDESHKKAWLIRVTINACKDHQRFLSRHKTTPLELLEAEEIFVSDESKRIIEAVISLPEKYRNVIYLFYYEGYSAVEISKILNKKENTIYSTLSRGRNILKNILGGDLYE